MSIALPAFRAAVLTPQPRVYLLGPFRFATDQAAPLTSPYTEAGAVGSLTLVQTDGQFSTSGGGLLFPSQTTPAWGDQYAVDASGKARLAGRALLGRVTFTAKNYCWYGWNDDATPLHPVGAPNVAAWYCNNAGNIFHYPSGADTGFVALDGVDYDITVVLRGTGDFLLMRGGSLATWTLLWVGNTGAQATHYPSFGNYLAAGRLRGGAYGPRVTDLGGLYATDTGIATTYKATTVNGDTATQTPNALVYHTITAQTGVTQELKFRITDASNNWLLRMAAPGTNTIKIIEVVATVETERASAAQTFVNATQYRIGVTMEGAAIASFVDTTAKGTYASAATGLTAGGVSVSHAGTKLECWPRNPAMPSGV